ALSGKPLERLRLACHPLRLGKQRGSGFTQAVTVLIPDEELRFQGSFERLDTPHDGRLIDSQDARRCQRAAAPCDRQEEFHIAPIVHNSHSALLRMQPARNARGQVRGDGVYSPMLRPMRGLMMARTAGSSPISRRNVLKGGAAVAAGALLTATGLSAPAQQRPPTIDMH